MTKATRGPSTSPEGPQGHPKATSEPGPCQWCSLRHYEVDCPFLADTGPIARGLFLTELMQLAADASRNAEVLYAEAFLEAQGTDRQRDQAAKVAAAETLHLAKDAAARVAGYRYMIGAGS